MHYANSRGNKTLLHHKTFCVLRQVGSTGVALLLMAMISAPTYAADAKAKYGPRDIFDTWVGVGGFGTSGPPPWQNRSWTKQPKFTAWGAAESKRLNDPANAPSCVPGGPVFAMTGNGNFPIQISEVPGQVLMIFENYPVPRRIYTDGRAHPPADELDPTWMGHSIGHWEGDTLVIDTVGTNGKFRPINGTPTELTEEYFAREPRLPTSDQLHMIERIRLVGEGGFLENQITVIDPKVYTEPLKATHYWKRRPDVMFVEYYCMENPRPEFEGYKSLPQSSGR